MELLDQFVVTMLRSSTPIILAAVAGLFAVRAGVFHLGMEGLMLAGAFTAVVAGVASGSVLFGLSAAVFVCLILSLFYWFLIDRLKADSVIAGLGLTAICAGARPISCRPCLGFAVRCARTFACPARSAVSTTGWELSCRNLPYSPGFSPSLCFLAG